jgi:hypothetical protein
LSIDAKVLYSLFAQPINPAVREKWFEKQALMDEACSPGRGPCFTDTAGSF